MANYKFGPGDLYDYYNGAVTRSPAFTGFPIVDLNDFDSGIYVSPALSVAIENLVRWVWQVKTWSVFFSENSSTHIFTSQAADEFGILDIPTWVFNADTYFGVGVIIDGTGQYGIQSDLYAAVDGINDAVFNLDNIESANTLVFASLDPPFNTATATELDYWDWA